MPPANPTPDPRAPPPGGDGPWAAFVRLHLHDYPPNALAIWLGVAAALAATQSRANPELTLAMTRDRGASSAEVPYDVKSRTA